MKLTSSSAARRAGLLGVLGAAAAALVAVRTRRAAGHSQPSVSRGADRTGDTSSSETYSCECGAGYRVSGTDRHRVFWPAGAPEDAPVLGDQCVECGAPLPSSRAAKLA
jgi:hypothetical protein